MTKVDWSKAPDNAAYYANGEFWREDRQAHFYYSINGYRCIGTGMVVEDYEPRPQQWPDESRISNIGQNGGDGLHYELNNAKTVKADEILSEGLQILTQRGELYGSERRECSFPQAAEAFNALTGHNIKGSDVCLILALVKQVRQYAQPRYHHDSAVDGVNYLALQAQELAKERK